MRSAHFSGICESFWPGVTKRHLDLILYAVEMHVFRDGHEFFYVLGAQYPAHMGPGMRYWRLAFFFQMTLLHVAPVVVCTQHHAASEVQFKGHDTRAVVTTERRFAGYLMLWLTCSWMSLFDEMNSHQCPNAHGSWLSPMAASDP